MMFCNSILYLLDQTPQLLFISSPNFVRLLFKSGYYLRAAFIKLRGIATATFADIDKDENKLEENKVVLEDC